MPSRSSITTRSMASTHLCAPVPAWRPPGSPFARPSRAPYPRPRAARRSGRRPRPRPPSMSLGRFGPQSSCSWSVRESQVLLPSAIAFLASCSSCGLTVCRGPSPKARLDANASRTVGQHRVQVWSAVCCCGSIGDIFIIGHELRPRSYIQLGKSQHLRQTRLRSLVLYLTFNIIRLSIRIRYQSILTRYPRGRHSFDRPVAPQACSKKSIVVSARRPLEQIKIRPTRQSVCGIVHTPVLMKRLLTKPTGHDTAFLDRQVH
jgi:hypothetical protein